MRIDVDGRPPETSAVLAELDAGARRGAAAARDASLAVLRSEAPGSFRSTSTSGSVRKTPTGVQVLVGPRPAKRWLYNFLRRGTGIYGPSGRPIRPRKAKAFRIAGRVVETVRGQPANPFIDRARPRAAAAAEQAIREEARKTADRARRR